MTFPCPGFAPGIPSIKEGRVLRFFTTAGLRGVVLSDPVGTVAPC